MTQPVTAVQKEFTRVSSAAWTQLFYFQPYNGGQGVSLACGQSSARVKLLGEYGSTVDDKVNVAVIVNMGNSFVNARLGDITVTADAGSMAIPPGGAVLCTIPGANDSADVYVAGYASVGSPTLQITTGFGN
jgi:hypothetical protein